LVQQCRLSPNNVDKMMRSHQVVGPEVLNEYVTEVCDHLWPDGRRNPQQHDRGPVLAYEAKLFGRTSVDAAKQTLANGIRQSWPFSHLDSIVFKLRTVAILTPSSPAACCRA
jgi:hypothetical protein